MLEFKKSKDITSDKFFSQIENSLGQKVEIRVSRQEISIVCKDTDEVISETIREKNIDVAITSESYENHGGGIWVKDKTC